MISLGHVFLEEKNREKRKEEKINRKDKKQSHEIHMIVVLMQRGKTLFIALLGNSKIGKLPDIRANILAFSCWMPWQRCVAQLYLLSLIIKDLKSYLNGPPSRERRKKNLFVSTSNNNRNGCSTPARSFVLLGSTTPSDALLARRKEPSELRMRGFLVFPLLRLRQPLKPPTAHSDWLTSLGPH